MSEWCFECGFEHADGQHGPNGPRPENYPDENYTLTETQCEERCDELRSQIKELRKQMELHVCPDVDVLKCERDQLREQLESAKAATSKEFLHRSIAESKDVERHSLQSHAWQTMKPECHELRSQVQRESALADSLAEALKACVDELNNGTSDMLIDRIYAGVHALAQHAAMRAGSSKAAE